MLVLRILFCTIGFILLGTSFVVYEDEERKIQSRLENYWIWLDERRLQLYASENLVLARFSSRLSGMIDGIFGSRLFSTRSAITSTSLSLISFSVMLVLLSLVAHLKVESFLWVFLSLLVTWGLICIFLSRRIVWAAILIWIIPFLLTVFFLSTSRSRAGERLHDFTIFFGAILISLMTDFLVIAAVRFLLWRATAGRSLFALLLAIIVGLALLQVVSVIPALLATSDELNLRLHPDRRVYYRLAQGLTLLNASDLFFLLSVLLVMALLFVNHAFWPSVQRPLYALQRGGFTKTRTVAASIGVAMICSGLGLSPMLDVLRKIFGG